MAATNYWLKCSKECGFAVQQRYFEDKKQFFPGICPRSTCAGKVLVYNADFVTLAVGKDIQRDPEAKDRGAVIEVK